MEEKEKQKFKVEKPIDLAKYYAFTDKSLDKSLNFQVSLANISGKGIYSKYKDDFDKLFKVYQSHPFDFMSYFKYIVLNGIKVEKIADSNIFYSFVLDLKAKEKYKKIYKYFLKSAKNITAACKELNFSRTVDYLKHIIKNNQLAGLYLSGKISEYYLANIALLPKIVSKLDPISKDTLNYLVLQQEKINSDLQDAFLHIKGIQVDAIKFTDKMIAGL